jgi:hypothetical protein
LTLRHQLNVLRRKSPHRLTFTSIDRLVFAGLYRLAPGVLAALKIVRPETVVRWHRAGFRAYWRWKSRPRSGLPAISNRPLFIAPHDFRSLAWDIAADCNTKQDTRELAARFIAPSSDPMWSEAAQEIFVACIVYLQATQGHGWGWRDLEAVATADLESLLDFAQTHNPNALRLLSQPDSRITQGILTTFQTHMRIVSVLADAWPDHFRRRFSIRAWLHGPSPDRPLILQQDPGHPELSRIWIGSMLSLLASAVGSPTLLESNHRRVRLFLDEFPQLPVIKQFPTFLELGRSKGIAVVIGAQDTAQIRAAYGADQAKSWFGMIGTKIITRINASEAAEDIIVRYTRSRNQRSSSELQPISRYSAAQRLAVKNSIT